MVSAREFTQAGASLLSIQSTPLSVGMFLMGALTQRQPIDFAEMLPAITAVALAHWSLYTLNDIVDVEIDKEQGRYSKPLVGNRHLIPAAWSLVGLMLPISSLIAFINMPLGSFILFMLAALCGLVYNVSSKTYSLSGLYLGVWAICMVLSGTLYIDPQVPLHALAIAGFGFFHMVWMTAEGSLKDIDTGEESIPKLFDCKVKDDTYPVLWTSIRFNIFATAVIAVQSLIIVLVPILDGTQSADVIPIYLGFFGAGLMATTWDSIIEHQRYDKDKITKKIALHEVTVVLTVGAVSLSFAPAMDLLVIIGGAVVWGLGTQTVLYGHPLRFP